MKRIILFVLLAFLPFLSIGQTANNLLAEINSQFKQYNSYNASLEVSGTKLIFKNDLSTSYIPFSSIDFRINYKHKSIDIYCIDGSKCIQKGGTAWDYYNISMIDNGKMAKSIFETLDKCRELRSIHTKSITNEYYSDSQEDKLRFINRQFDLYNKYYSRFDIEDDKLVFSNKFGTAKTPLNQIYFKVTEKNKSVEFHCKDGSKCIEVYNPDGDLSTWNYYNVSLVDENSNMVNVVYEVKDKCDGLQAQKKPRQKSYNNAKTANLLDYINGEFQKYNSYDSFFSVDKYNKTLIFSNSMGDSEPIPLANIDFRINEQHKSIDIYCIDGSRCIKKGSDWDYYNVSLIDNGEMISHIGAVTRKCKELKSIVMTGESGDYIKREKKKPIQKNSTTGSTEDN
ncbi:MAG: hypothetical protein ACPG19_14380 [Saprospiraceae bacterium]